MAYTVLATVKEYLALDSSTAHDALINRCIAAAQAAIDSYTGKRFEATDSTTHYFSQSDLDGTELLLDSWLSQLDSITNGDGQTLATNLVTPEPRNTWPIIALKSANWRWSSSESEVAIIGRWSWSVSAPADIVQACVRWSAYTYRLKDAAIFEATANNDLGQLMIIKGIPSDVKALLDSYRGLF